ncbi:isochorismate synthase [Ruicaihuangia caeni]|uniref:isochorismate synthase n=1 Tax=Ruicaihuangia caeni TaxID=3042517 RepID=A0AAW6TC10_9MICO|nr:isochorismate synthase [Klugiella sp. YN-L-19]MDI2098895.1 isochorismate synthase [Klugiella sp. YN-L-19]
MSAVSSAAASLRAVTTAIDLDQPLIPLADPRHPLVFVRRGEGVVGFGEALRLEFAGAERMREAASAWKSLVERASVTDPVGVAGSGLIAFGTFAFSAQSSATSTLIVPRLVVGRRGDAAWLTRIDIADMRLDGGTASAAQPIDDLADAEAVNRALSPAPWGHPVKLALDAGTPTASGYLAAVTEAVQRIHDGALSKVVLARTLTGELPADADLRRVIAALALGYPDCHTYAVDGLIGSSPETLVRVEQGTVSARVLAGSAARGVDQRSDEAAAAALATSTKDLDEHRFAVQSVLAALDPFARALSSDEVPFTLKLPNLWHLATDVEGTLSAGASSLDLIDALHPTAAVAGTPTDTAMRMLAELEGFDRGRYAGPVGWVDADGDGEWAIALRGAQIDSEGRVTAFAGAGIVAESDPEAELAETRMKFKPVVEAFD